MDFSFFLSRKLLCLHASSLSEIHIKILCKTGFPSSLKTNNVYLRTNLRQTVVLSDLFLFIPPAFHDAPFIAALSISPCPAPLCLAIHGPCPPQALSTLCFLHLPDRLPTGEVELDSCRVRKGVGWTSGCLVQHRMLPPPGHPDSAQHLEQHRSVLL